MGDAGVNAQGSAEPSEAGSEPEPSEKSKRGQNPPEGDLGRLAALWPNLPQDVRGAVMVLVGLHGGKALPEGQE